MHVWWKAIIRFTGFKNAYSSYFENKKESFRSLNQAHAKKTSTCKSKCLKTQFSASRPSERKLSSFCNIFAIIFLNNFSKMYFRMHKKNEMSTNQMIWVGVSWRTRSWVWPQQLWQHPLALAIDELLRRRKMNFSKWRIKANAWTLKIGCVRSIRFQTFLY